MHSERRTAEPPRAAAAVARPFAELTVALAIAWALVIARSIVYLIDDQTFFNSDQAITGLMAKHLLEGRAFPLFYYGQPYLLAVQAWLAVPFFAVAGPSVAALTGSVLASNLAVVTILVVLLCRSVELRPLLAIVPALFYALAPRAAVFWLLDAGGANGMPFLYVLLLWLLRDRPVWLGAIAALAFLNREFSAYAIPMLLVVDVWQHRLFTRERLRHWMLAAVAALALVQTVQALKPFADYYGPGSRGELLRGFDESQAGNLRQRMELVAAELPGRTAAMIGEHAPRLLGARAWNDGLGESGHAWLRWPLLTALSLIGVRVLVLWRRGPPARVPAVGLYLTGVGVIAAAVYVLTRPADDPVDRYFVLVLLVPVGLTACHLAIETRAWYRTVTVAAVLCWSVLSAADHAALMRYYEAHGVPHDLHDVIAALGARNAHVAEAGYWRAYKITFLAREQIKVASTDFARIDEYQRLANEAGPALVTISEQPCDAGERVNAHYLCTRLPPAAK
ncbi:MAG: hypothetical protein IT184_00860 [Acidobacteria bacterium]|nr:hypothetical protein [Acidobacteriota bacterium]